MTQFLKLILFLGGSCFRLIHTFDVVWNAPLGECQRFGVNIDVAKYGIKANNVGGWRGRQITIFYAVRFCHNVYICYTYTYQYSHKVFKVLTSDVTVSWLQKFAFVLTERYGRIVSFWLHPAVIFKSYIYT